jgi:hypothetical protein
MMAIYFTVGESGSDARFVIRLDSSEKIAHARAILDGSETLRVHVQGTIVRAPAPYNPTWSFHLDPASIEFFAMAIEVCDARTQYVEDHLSEIGSAFLPNAHWCPWSSRVVAELKSL